jgi:hypothetical protein
VPDGERDRDVRLQRQYRLETTDAVPPFSDGRRPLLIRPDAWDRVARPGLAVRADWTAATVVHAERASVPSGGQVSATWLDDAGGQGASRPRQRQGRQRHVNFAEPPESDEDKEPPPPPELEESEEHPPALAAAGEAREKAASDVIEAETAAIKAELDAGEARTASLTAANTAANTVPAGGSESPWSKPGSWGVGGARAAYVEDAEDSDEEEEEEGDSGWIPIKEESPDRRWSPSRLPRDSSPGKRSNSSPDKRSDSSPYRRSTIRLKAGTSVAAAKRWSETPRLEPGSSRAVRRGRSGSWSSSLSGSGSGSGSGYSARTDATESGSEESEAEDYWADVPRAQVLPRDQKGRPLSFMVEVPKDVPNEAAAARADSMKFYDWKPGMGQTFRDYKLDVMDVFGARVANVSDEIKVEVITTEHHVEGTDFRWL